MSDNISKFLNFVNVISNKPGMFLINNVEDISLMIYGYKMACSDYSVVFDEIDNFLRQFKGFINSHYNTKDDIDWARLIRFYCVNDSTTLDFFKYKFSEFVAQVDINALATGQREGY